MKSEGLFKPVALVFAATLVLYLASFYGLEHLRVRQGPWQVTFTNDASGTPLLRISQAHLGISDFRILFEGEEVPPDAQLGEMIFATPRPVPYAVPFGQCIFEDLTFLPGTVTFDLFGHPIELLPRVLLARGSEQLWKGEHTLVLKPSDKPKPNRAPARRQY